MDHAVFRPWLAAIDDLTAEQRQEVASVLVERSPQVARASAPADPASPPSAASAAEGAVLRGALDEERERTTALRRELDEARVALATVTGEAEGLGRHRDIWADRSAQLRTRVKEAHEALRAAAAERDVLRARVGAHDGELDTLRLHRDIWAERARALATALCRDPAAGRDGPGARAVPPAAPERERPSVKVAR